MQEQEIELSIGDLVQVGDHAVTVVDIEGGIVTFRVDHEEDCEIVATPAYYESIPR